MHLAEPTKKRGFSAAPEFVRNVMGSSAGAGSGEFHVYRHIRRRENARLKFIAEEAAKVGDPVTDLEDRWRGRGVGWARTTIYL